MGNASLPTDSFGEEQSNESLVNLDRSLRCGVVWLHGLGDVPREAGWNGIIRQQLVPSRHASNCLYLFPRAPIQLVPFCYYLPMTSWFSFECMGIGADFDPPRHGCSLDECHASAVAIMHAIDELQESYGIPPERIVVGGFSQGGGVAIQVALTYRYQLAACIVFSGAMMGNHEMATSVSQGLRVFWGHGVHDDLAFPSLLDEGVAALQSVGAKVTARKYGMGHTWVAKEMQDASAFLEDVLAA